MSARSNPAVGLLAFLAGCGGGGGTVPVVPTQVNFTSWSAVPANSKVSVPAMSQSATGTFNTIGSDITVTSIGAVSAVDTTASNVSITFGPSRNLTAIAISTPGTNVSWSNSLLGGGSIGCSAGACVASSASGDSGAVLIDPTVAGWNYQTFGVWATGTMSTGTLGALSAGAPTPVPALPVTGTSTYNGMATGYYVDAGSGGQLKATSASMTAVADFGARTVAFSTSGTSVSTSGGSLTPNAGLDISGKLAFGAGNQFSGTVTTVNAQLNGSATGRFYGPAAEELGGTYNLKGTGVSAMLGGFGGKR